MSLMRKKRCHLILLSGSLADFRLPAHTEVLYSQQVDCETLPEGMLLDYMLVIDYRVNLKYGQLGVRAK